MTLVLELPDEQESLLKNKAQAEGVTSEQYAQKLLERELNGPRNLDSNERRHISAVILDRVQAIPAEMFADLPEDGADEHDHYIYGLGRRKT